MGGGGGVGGERGGGGGRGGEAPSAKTDPRVRLGRYCFLVFRCSHIASLRQAGQSFCWTRHCPDCIMRLSMRKIVLLTLAKLLVENSRFEHDGLRQDHK